MRLRLLVVLCSFVILSIAAGQEPTEAPDHPMRPGEVRRDGEMTTDEVPLATSPATTPKPGIAVSNGGLLMTPLVATEEDMVILGEDYFGLACPRNEIPTVNAFCESDDDCGKGTTAKCYLGLSDLRTSKGICCTSDDYQPKVLASCPEDLYARTRFACGLGLGGCPDDSLCFAAKDWFGRCCSEKEEEPVTLRRSFYTFGGAGATRWPTERDPRRPVKYGVASIVRLLSNHSVLAYEGEGLYFYSRLHDFILEQFFNGVPERQIKDMLIRRYPQFQIHYIISSSKAAITEGGWGKIPWEARLPLPPAGLDGQGPGGGNSQSQSQAQSQQQTVNVILSPDLLTKIAGRGTNGRGPVGRGPVRGNRGNVGTGGGGFGGPGFGGGFFDDSGFGGIPKNFFDG